MSPELTAVLVFAGACALILAGFALARRIRNRRTR